MCIKFILHFRPAMKPEYMPLAEANQILETGRGMHFLHNICQQRPPLTAAQASLLELQKQECKLASYSCL